jgi:hypothetical protein
MTQEALNKIEGLLERTFLELEEGKHEGAPFEKGKNNELRGKLAQQSKVARKEKGYGPAGRNAAKSIIQTGNPYAVPADSKESKILKKQHGMNTKDVSTVFHNRDIVVPKHKDEK